MIDVWSWGDVNRSQIFIVREYFHDQNFPNRMMKQKSNMKTSNSMLCQLTIIILMQ